MVILSLFIYYFLLFIASIAFLRFFKRINIFLLGFLVLFPFLFFKTGIVDIELFQSVGYFSANRLDIYYLDSDHMLYPYFPLLSLILGIIFKASQILPIGFLTLWRIVTILALIGLSGLIYKLLLKLRDKRAADKVTIFVLSPLSLFPVALHAHPDVVLLLFYFLGVYLLTYKKNLGLLAYVSLGFSVLAKTWSIIFLPLIFFGKTTYSKKGWGIFIICSTIAVVCLFYLRFWHSLPERLISAVSGYSGSWNVDWGPQGIISQFFGFSYSKLFRLIYTVLVFSFAYFMIIRAKAGVLAGSRFLMLTFFVFTLSWAPQYVFWVWPFVAAVDKIGTVKRFSILSAPYVLAAYANLSLGFKVPYLVALCSLPLWFFGLTLWYRFYTAYVKIHS